MTAKNNLCDVLQPIRTHHADIIMIVDQLNLTSFRYFWTKKLVCGLQLRDKMQLIHHI